MPYDELGNYIPYDTLTLDEMRYALLHSGQKAPPPGYEYAKPGRMPLRPDGSDVPMLPEEVARTLVRTPPPEPKKPYSTATNVPQAIADRLGMSAIPQAALQIATGFPAEVAKGMGYPETSKAIANFGRPTSEYANAINEALAVAPQKITGSHMGFGPLPETWISGLGNLSPNDARVLAKQNIERARELRAIPEDFRNAQAGFQRESALGGNTYGGNLQRAADDIGDVLARNQARRSEYATPMSGSVEVFGNLVPDTAMYAVRPNKSGSQVIREVPTPLNPAYSVTGESRLSEDLTDIVDMPQPRERDDKSYQHLNQFTNFVPGDFNKSAKDMFHEFIQPALAQEFPGTPTADHSRAIHAKYGNNANEWYKKQLEAFALTPEAKLHNEKAFQVAMSDPDIPDPFEFLKDVLIIPPSAHFASKKASDAWVMNNLQNYLVEHLGTPGDPALKVVAETGRAGLDPSKLEQIVGNQRLADEARDLRTRAGMPAEGTYERELNKYFDLLPQQNMVIQMLQDKENELISANPGVRPQDIPGWKEARKEVVQATKRKDETAAKLENLRVAQALENYNDTQVKIANEKDFTENLEPYFKERFPMLPTNKDVAFQMRVPAQFRELAKDTQNRLAISGAPGIKNIVKPEDIGSYSVPKAVQIRAEMMMQREKMTAKAAKANEQKLMTHIKSRMDTMPQDGTFGPATVGRIGAGLGSDQVKADLSDITYWMDHCIGRGGSPSSKTLSPFALMLGADNAPSRGKYRQYQPSVLSHLGNRVPPGSSGAMTSYMNDVMSGSSQIIDFRDTATGIPYATLNLKPSNNDKSKFRIGEFYGYQDGKVQGPMVPGRGREYTAEEIQPYRQAVADWANSQADSLVPTSGDYLIDHADVYDLEYSDHRNSLARQLGVNVKEAKEMAYTMGKRFVTGDEAKAIWKAEQEAPKDTVDSLRDRRDELAIELREAEDPDSSYGEDALDDLRNSITDLDNRIAAMENRPPIGARAVAQTVQLMPDWNRMVNEIREDTRTQLDADDAAAMANAIEETQNLFTFSQQPHEFVAELERRADQFENNNENREEVARAIRNVAMGYDSQIINEPATGITPETINALANNIVVRNAAFRDQTTANIVNAIEDQLLPSFQRFNPVIPGDRQELERQLSFFQNRPLDQDLGTRIESYIASNPLYENRIRERIADFMIDQIQQHLGNRPQAPQGEDLDTQLFGITNRIRENYGDTFANVVDFVVASATDEAGSINDNPRQWIGAFQRDTLNYRDEVRQALDDVVNQLETAYAAQTQPAAQLPAAVPERAGADSVAPLVRNALNALPNLRDNAFVTEIVAQQVVDLSGQVNFGQRPQDFIQQLSNRAQMLEETPGNGETNVDDNIEAARQMRMLSNSLSAQAPAAQVPAVAIGDAYATVQRAIQPLIEGEHIVALEPIAEGIMGNRNGVYADLTDAQRLNLRQQIYDAMDRVRVNQEPAPLTDIVAMDMNRIRDNYGQEVYDDVDGVLTAINDDYDLDTDPALFIERIRRQEDMNRVRGDVEMRNIYNNLATQLTNTLRENNAIADARRRARNNVPALANPDAPITDNELQTVDRSLRDPLSTAMASPPRIFDAYNAAIQDINRNDTPEDALRHLSVVRGILLDPDTDLQASFGLQEPADRERLDALIRRHGDAIRQLAERDQEPDEQGLVLEDDQLDDIASDYLNSLDNPTIQLIRQEADDMRNGMIDLPEFRDLTQDRREEAQNAIAMRMDQYSDMMGDMNIQETAQAPALPTPASQIRIERDAINDATRWPRFWFARYPDIPNDVVYEVISRLNRQHRPEDFAGMRENAVDANPRTIFRDLNPVQRRQAAAMIDDIGNFYQNRLQRTDNQTEQLAQGQYNNATEAFNGLLAANNNFMLPTPEEGLNTLRALPQLLGRENLREHFGTTQLSQRQRQELEQHINELIRQRTENPQLPPPEGHKRGGYIKKKKMSDGGKVEPSAPSSSVNDQSKPVTPIKPIQNPDAPEFRDILNRERANRSNVSAGSSMPELSKYEPRIQELVRSGAIPYADAAWMNEYSKTKGDSRVETGKGAFKDQSEKMQNFVNRMRAGEIPTPPQFKATVGGGGSGGGSGGADLKHLMNPRNITYRDGGSVSLDTMRYELTRKQ